MINSLIQYYKNSHTIISGGQTGADQAGLDAAKSLGFITGGWAPKNWETMDGPSKELLESYGLKEHSGGYRPRTIQNVKDSDITIIVSRKWKSPGTILTINSCIRNLKPFIALQEDGKIYQHECKLLDELIKKPDLIIEDLNDQEPPFELYASVLKNYLVINCAGNAEHNAPGITEKSFNLFFNIFRRMYS